MHQLIDNALCGKELFLFWAWEVANDMSYQADMMDFLRWNLFCLLGFSHAEGVQVCAVFVRWVCVKLDSNPGPFETSVDPLRP